MEYVEGELLSARVAKGPLPIREVVEIGLQVSDALDEAHGRGIIHRDVKSANLMRTERGLVKVLDFGLAKFVKSDAAESSLVTQPQVTVAGMVVGTVSYMAPEQALGRPVDHRTDLFSLGVVLFELATGRIPFVGTSPTEIVDRILHEIPPPPSRFASGVTSAFDAVVARALEKSPTFRYQSARDLHHDLQQVALELDDSQRSSTSRVSAGASGQAIERSVAVMTFANITREPADDWIGTGIAETVSSDLKNIHGLTVIGRARVYDALRNLSSGTHLDESLAIDIGRRLGATWVVVGGFQRLGELVRITANFVIVETGAVKRTVKVDGRVGDIFALQDKIVYELTGGLNVALRGTEVAEHREAGDEVGRGLRELRARDDEPPPRDARLDRARHRRVRGRDSARRRVRPGLGGARRRLRAQGLVSLDFRPRPQGRRHGAARDSRSIPASPTPTTGSGPAADARQGRRCDRVDTGGDSPRSRERPGLPDPRPRPLGRPGRLRRGDSGVPQGHRAQSRGRLFLPAARPVAGVAGRV